MAVKIMEKQYLLFEKYPQIFKQKDLDMKQTAMCWGCECGDGWFNLLDDMCSKLNLISKTSGLIIEATQVKEKFATLRFYYQVYKKEPNKFLKLLNKIGIYKPKYNKKDAIWSKLIDDVVELAEAQSEFICEKCGKRNYESCVRNMGGWRHNMCDECYEKYKKEHKK